MATFQEMCPDWEMGVKRMPTKLLKEIRYDSKYARLTFQSNSVALERLHGLLEQGFASGGHPRNVVLLPLNGSVDILENLLDGVGDLVTNTVTGDEGHLNTSSDITGILHAGTGTYGVDTTVLGRQLSTSSKVSSRVQTTTLSHDALFV